MGSKDRIQRIKDKIYNAILDAAMGILKSEGCEALSIRKIADKIEYSAPVLYSYFLNKEDLLIELSKRGFSKLVNCIEQSLLGLTSPKERLESMLLAHITFARKESELYQLMYSVGIHVSDVMETFPVLTKIGNIFRRELLGKSNGQVISEDSFRERYLTYLSFAHGLASLNLYFKDIDFTTNLEIAKNAALGIFCPEPVA